ncbi:Succinoglycan biosynthesis transport protein ExoP [Neorhizobium galegae bv. officinalis bv. officinalis str. HAMBI 1141]|uniref:non-specific protein-tyrosine kinase n=1 Tax=Neorhizobium galegae bv. officinalis bv. officinalis str. HAMBI 1141 TaxID=1028801 RepID=A0A068TE70_NEOGA|nr:MULTISPECIES: polysaccharide biosynthesis tyrosine autokinase [Neorhizobium]MCJ9670473.1 polysaccharide biosynthesis tyrosine autokinase [Neorhizobium sp. SHOUNA12B]MCJ9744322.1 polysaccharide biosynthesis tyrosine autokinase [Neorhizobium sp. SHOUNA12A]MCJ9750225.1 polysaccharide biosynthesis tyrosine autokinase [Neorhizobium sp. BETTINA12A]CDN55680.1 Succinoglycan biosynthesis transport protein ExoP [Neorhizobium galegae bv. officinalis bv. officinalis str. HAMBI 1141]
MDQVNFRPRTIFPSETRDHDTFIDLDKLWAAAIRRSGVIVVCLVVTVVLAGVYLVMAQPIYTALTQILIDDNLSRYADDPQDSQTAQQIDNRMSSAVEILKSKALAVRVVDKAKLDQNEAVVNPPQSPVDLAKGAIRSVVALLTPGSPPPSEENVRMGRVEKAAAVLQQSLTVERVGRSSVIALSIRSPDPQLAALITRTYAESYLTEQLNANFDATERASLWLQERLNDLNTRSQQASLAVEQFKTQHGLVSPRGELLSTQQLSDLNSQLIVAQADAATASARYNQYQAIIDKGPDAAVQNAVVSARDTDNTVIQDLRKRYINISDREQGIIQQFGANHPQAVALKTEKSELAQQIYRELQQLTGSFRNVFEVASSREKSLRESIDRVAGRNSEANVSMVQLRELEQKAAALKTLYESFLGRFEEATQRQSFPIAKARVISDAGLPTAPSSPRKTLTMALSVVLGLLIGGAAATLLEFRERFFRTGDDVQEKLGLRFLGYLPKVSGAFAEDAPPPPPTEAEAAGAPPGNPISFRRLMRVAVEAPRSQFAETLRNAKLACDIMLQERKCRVIGVVSCLPGEGKSMVAANFAGLIASTGVRTLVIDADLRNPGLSRMLASEPEVGLVEVVLQQTPWTNAARVDRRSRLTILPMTTRSKQLAHTSELLASSGMSHFLESIKDTFDVIVVDLAPLLPVIDAKAFEPYVDGFVFVTEWGVTPAKAVQSVIRSEPQIASKTVGVILNKTEMSELHRYADPGAPERLHSSYVSYYKDGSASAPR